MAQLYDNGSTRTQECVPGWWEEFQDAAKPAFEELHNEVALGRKAECSASFHRHTDYRAELEEVLGGGGTQCR